jgi:hypothetical protein
MTTRWARTLAGGSFLASVLLSATVAVFLVQALPRPVSHGVRFQRVPDRVGHRGRRGWGRPRRPQVSSVDVRFEERQDLGFEIRHDGVGFDPPDPTRSGMANMRDRIKALGGTFVIRSDPGHGTAVRGRVPLDGSPA